MLVGELTVGVAGGVQHTGAGIGHVGDYGDEVQIVHEADGLLAATLQTKGDDATSAVGQVLLGQGVVAAGRQGGVVDPSHLVVLLQPPGHLQCVGTVLAHAQCQCLQAEVQQKAVLRGGNAAEVAHELHHHLGYVGHLAERGGVGQAVVALVRLGQAGELVVLSLPVKVAAVHYAAAHLCGMAVHVLGGGVCDDVGSPLERAAVDGCGKGVVYDKGYAVAVCQTGKAFDVEDASAGVADGLAEEAFGVGAESSLNALVVPVRVHEGAFYAQLLQRDAEEVERAAVDVVGCDEVVAGLADIEYGIEVGSLA